MANLSDVVRAGNLFYQRVMEVDAAKDGVAKPELERRLTAFITEFVATSGLGLEVVIGFCDVHALMNNRWHTELSYVRLNGHRCELLFHDRLIDFRDPNAGFVFIAKSWVLLMVIEEMLNAVPDVKAEFVFEIGDNATLDAVSFNSTNPNACLILDFQFAESNGYAGYRAYCEQHMVAWESRAPKVFWRGSTTGMRRFNPPGPEEPDDLSWLPRLQLCSLTNNSSLAEHCDTGISTIVQIPEPYLTERIRHSGMMKPSVNREVFLEFQGVFDIDGNANSWSGLFYSLLGASCVLKVSSSRGFRQWYYPSLKPWQNFIPISSDFSDLYEAVLWFIAHPSHACEIGARGRELAISVDTKYALKISAGDLHRFCANRPT